MKIPIVISICICGFVQLVFGQTDAQLSNMIISKDSVFWVSYNSCNTSSMQSLLTDDVEFYHDKGGITLGRENLIASIQKNLCSNENFRLRREAVKGTMKVFPLKNNGIVYGALISGEHVFYILEKGKPERLDGLAKFSQLWILKENTWKMSRILSYDHGPAKR